MMVSRLNSITACDADTYAVYVVHLSTFSAICAQACIMGGARKPRVFIRSDTGNALSVMIRNALLARHHALICRLQSFADRRSVFPAALHAQMSFAQLVHELGPHLRTALAQQFGADAELLADWEVFISPRRHLGED